MKHYSNNAFDEFLRKVSEFDVRPRKKFVEIKRFFNHFELKNKIMKPENWYQFNSKVQSFQYEDEPEVIHIIKMGSTELPNKYIVVYDDPYQIATADSEILTKDEIESKFNIVLTIQFLENSKTSFTFVSNDNIMKYIKT